MNLRYYQYSTNSDFKDYVFFSEGPRGRIKKVVRFTKVEENPDVYNLGFGDENPETGKVDDLIVTDNKDSDVVLRTVVETVVNFNNHYDNYYIYAKGSTPARTRLYQIGITSLLEDIKQNFEVYGLVNGDWHEFEKSVNYEAFLIKKK